MEPVIERPSLPLGLHGLVQALTTICQQYGQRINRMLRGPYYPITDAERAAGLAEGDLDTRYPELNILRYGAAIDGSTDDSSAWQAAFNVAAAKGGGVVPVLPGTSIIDRRVNGKAGVSLIGSGWRCVVKRGPNLGQEMFTFKDAEATDVTLANFACDVNADSDFNACFHFDAANTSSGNWVSVWGMKFFNSAEASADDWTLTALILQGVSDVNVFGNVFLNTQCKLAGAGDSRRITCRGNVSYHPRAHGISCVVSNDSTLEDVVISNNIVINPARSCIFVGRDGVDRPNTITRRISIVNNLCVSGSRLENRDNQILQLIPGDTDTDTWIIANNRLVALQGEDFGISSAIRMRKGSYSVTGNVITGVTKEASVWTEEGVTIHFNGNYVATEASIGLLIDSAYGLVANNYFDGLGENQPRVFFRNSDGRLANNVFRNFDGHAVALRVTNGGTTSVFANGNLFPGTTTAYSVDDTDTGTIDLIVDGDDLRGASNAFSPANGTIRARNNWGYVTENWGSASISPDSSGNATIAHGLAGTPDYVSVHIRGDTANHADVQSVDSTHITVRIKDSSGADVTSGTFTVDWEARLGPSVAT